MKIVDNAKSQKLRKIKSCKSGYKPKWVCKKQLLEQAIGSQNEICAWILANKHVSCFSADNEYIKRQFRNSEIKNEVKKRKFVLSPA
jgi:hypothetical protein